MFACAPACGWTFACSAWKSSLARSIASCSISIDDLAAAVVPLAGYPSAYLLVGTEPTASRIDGQVKFSDAISSI